MGEVPNDIKSRANELVIGDLIEAARRWTNFAQKEEEMRTSLGLPVPSSVRVAKVAAMSYLDFAGQLAGVDIIANIEASDRSAKRSENVDPETRG